MKKILPLFTGLALTLVACGGNGGGSDKAGGPSDFCEAAVEFLEVQTEADPTNPDSQKELFEKIEVASQKIAETAPDEIKGESQTVAEQVPVIRQTLEEVDYDVNKLTPEQQQALQGEEFTKAFETVLTYMSTNCKEVQERLGGVPSGQPTPAPGGEGTEQPTETTQAPTDTSQP